MSMTRRALVRVAHVRIPYDASELPEYAWIRGVGSHDSARDSNADAEDGLWLADVELEFALDRLVLKVGREEAGRSDI